MPLLPHRQHTCNDRGQSANQRLGDRRFPSSFGHWGNAADYDAKRVVQQPDRLSAISHRSSLSLMPVDPGLFAIW